MGNDLRNRIARPTGQQPGTAVAVTADSPLVDQVRAMEDQFALAMPRGGEAAQLVRDVLTLLSQNPKLKECVPSTVLGGAMTMAQLGLRPGVLGHGWLLPFYDNRAKAMKAQLVIGYLGYVELINRTGRVSDVGAHAVHVNDEFVLGFVGGRREFTHRVDWFKPRGELLGWYAAGQVHGADAVSITDPASVAEMEAHRDRFAMAKSGGNVVGPWRDNFESMAKKTMVLRLAKLLPKSTELAYAIDADQRVRVDLTPAGIEHSEPVLDGEVVADSADVEGQAAGEQTGGDA